MYFFSVNGSTGILSNLEILLNVVSQKSHCCHIIHQEYVISVQSVVTGYFQAPI